MIMLLVTMRDVVRVRSCEYGDAVMLMVRKAESGSNACEDRRAVI